MNKRTKLILALIIGIVIGVMVENNFIF